MLEVILMPKERGLCPASENYTCVVNTATEIAWHTVSTERRDLVQSLGGDSEEYVEAGGFQVTFIKNRTAKKVISSLHVGDLNLNGTNLTCEGSGLVGDVFTTIFNNTTIYVLGRKLTTSVEYSVCYCFDRSSLISNWSVSGV